MSHNQIETRKGKLVPFNLEKVLDGTQFIYHVSHARSFPKDSVAHSLNSRVFHVVATAHDALCSAEYVKEFWETKSLKNCVERESSNDVSNFIETARDDKDAALSSSDIIRFIDGVVDLNDAVWSMYIAADRLDPDEMKEGDAGEEKSFFFEDPKLRDHLRAVKREHIRALRALLPEMGVKYYPESDSEDEEPEASTSPADPDAETEDDEEWSPRKRSKTATLLSEVSAINHPEAEGEELEAPTSSAETEDETEDEGVYQASKRSSSTT